MDLYVTSTCDLPILTGNDLYTGQAFRQLGKLCAQEGKVSKELLRIGELPELEAHTCRPSPSEVEAVAEELL